MVNAYTKKLGEVLKTSDSENQQELVLVEVNRDNSEDENDFQSRLSAFPNSSNFSDHLKKHWAH